jgi:hypothetical protein
MAAVEAPLAEAVTFGELSIPREYVITQQGREYILADGLLVGLVQLSKGHYDITTEIAQLPTAENAQTAVVTAKVTVFARNTGDVLRTATGIGDANPANVGRMVAPHVLRMAETRAVARALRHLLGLGLTALEELSQGAEETPASTERPRPASFDRPAGPRPVSGAAGTLAPEETISLDGADYTRTMVVRVKHQRIAEAQAAGLHLAPLGTPGGPPADGAPLQAQVDFSRETRRRLEVRSGAVHANGAGGK